MIYLQNETLYNRGERERQIQRLRATGNNTESQEHNSDQKMMSWKDTDRMNPFMLIKIQI